MKRHDATSIWTSVRGEMAVVCFAVHFDNALQAVHGAMGLLDRDDVVIHEQTEKLSLFCHGKGWVRAKQGTGTPRDEAHALERYPRDARASRAAEDLFCYAGSFGHLSTRSPIPRRVGQR